MLKVDEAWDDIVEVQREVNGRIDYTSDPTLFGKPDFWEIVQDAGDCDDYAVTKRSMLRKRFPDNKDAFCLAVCGVHNPKGDHLVLIVKTDKGDYVLDNRYPEVAAWHTLTYTWVSREIPGQFLWERLTSRN